MSIKWWFGRWLVQAARVVWSLQSFSVRNCYEKMLQQRGGILKLKTRQWCNGKLCCMTAGARLSPLSLFSKGVGLLESDKPVRRVSLACLLVTAVYRQSEWEVLWGLLNCDGGGAISSESRLGQSQKSVQQVLQFEQGWHCLPLIWGPDCQVGQGDPFLTLIVKN